MYNTATLLLVSGFTAVALTSGLLARELVSIYKIPSRSMDPTILSGHRVGQLKHAVEV
jgi:signal peptidase I